MSENTKRSNKKFLIISTTFFIVVILLIISSVVGKEFGMIDKERVHYKQVLSVPNKDLIDLRTREFNTLNSYAVVDKDAGIYRIPITRAMELKVKDAK